MVLRAKHIPLIASEDLERSLEGTQWETDHMSEDQLRIRKAYRVKLKGVGYGFKEKD